MMRVKMDLGCTCLSQPHMALSHLSRVAIAFGLSNVSGVRFSPPHPYPFRLSSVALWAHYPLHHVCSISTSANPLVSMMMFVLERILLSSALLY